MCSCWTVDGTSGTWHRARGQSVPWAEGLWAAHPCHVCLTSCADVLVSSCPCPQCASHQTWNHQCHSCARMPCFCGCWGQWGLPGGVGPHCPECCEAPWGALWRVGSHVEGREAQTGRQWGRGGHTGGRGQSLTAQRRLPPQGTLSPRRHALPRKSVDRSSLQPDFVGAGEQLMPLAKGIKAGMARTARKGCSASAGGGHTGCLHGHVATGGAPATRHSLCP